VDAPGNPPQNKHLPAGERRAATVAAMIALAAEQDPREITTRAIAGRMGLTEGALFRHFPTKEAVWETAIEWVAENLLARIDEAALAATSSLAALEAIFVAHIDFVAKHPGVPRLIFGELQRAEDTPAKRAVQSLLEQYGLRLRALMEQGKAQGELAPSVDSGVAAPVFIGIVQGLVMQSLLAGTVQRMRTGAPGAFALYARAIRRVP
jgi:AcrR family transcriptional regulator